MMAVLQVLAPKTDAPETDAPETDAPKPHGRKAALLPTGRLVRIALCGPAKAPAGGANEPAAPTAQWRGSTIPLASGSVRALAFAGVRVRRRRLLKNKAA